MKRKAVLRRPFRPALFGAVLLGVGAALVPGPFPHAAHAQAPPASVRLPAQAMSTALLALARATGAQIVFHPDLVLGRRIKAVDATGAEDALAQMLQGADLTYLRVGDGSYVIVGRSSDRSRNDPAAAPLPSQAEVPSRILLLDAPAPSVSELVVSPSRGRVEDALREQQNDVSVGNVLSGEQIEQAAVSSVADLAPLIPGLAQHRDEFQGQAATGEGQYITIRGFDTSYNAYSLNGVRLAQTDAASRAVSVNLFSPFGLGSIKVDKAPTSDQDGDSVAGILDFRTPTAFDFAGRHVRVRVQGQVAEQAATALQPDLGGAVQLEYADRLRSDGRLGVYATVYYQDRNSTAEEVGAQNAPVLDNGFLTGSPRDHPDHLVMNGEQWNFYRETIRRLGGNISLDYRGEGLEFYWRMQYARYRNDMTQDQQSLRTRATDEQSPPPANNRSAVVPGVNRNAGIGAMDYDAATGAFAPYGVEPGHYFQFNAYDQTLAATELGGRSRFGDGRFTMDYALAYSYGDYATAQHYEAGQWGPPYIGGAAGSGSGVAAEGVTFDLSDPARPRPRLSPAAAAYAYDPWSTRAWSIDYWNDYSREGLLTLRDDLAWALGRGWLSVLRAGVKYELAERNSEDTGNQADERVYIGYPGVAQYTPQQPQFYQGRGAPTAIFPGSDLNSFMGGAYPGPFRLMDVATYKALWASLEAANPTNRAAAALAYARSRISGSETRWAGYVEAVIKLGALSIQPGVRYEANRDRFTSFQSDGAGGGVFVTQTRAYDELLPGVSAAWRPDGRTVLRASVRESYARPAFDQLYGPTSVTNQSGDIIIVEPNPDLKPLQAVDYDIGFERYDDRGGVFQVDGYFKDLRNVIFAAGSTNTSTAITGNVTTTRGNTTVNTTLNGLSGHAIGVEASLRKRFSALPQLLDGLGFAGNVTVQASTTRYAVSPAEIRSSSLPNAPDLLYSLQLFYDKHGLAGAVTYSYQGLALQQLQITEPDIYAQPTRTLNLSLAYRFPSGVKVGAAVQNLLDDYTYWATYGKGRRLLAQGANNEGGYVETGRNILVSLAYEF